MALLQSIPKLTTEGLESLVAIFGKTNRWNIVQDLESPHALQADPPPPDIDRWLVLCEQLLQAALVQRKAGSEPEAPKCPGFERFNDDGLMELAEGIAKSCKGAPDAERGFLRDLLSNIGAECNHRGMRTRFKRMESKELGGPRFTAKWG